MNNSYITIIKEKRTALSRKRIPLNQNGCTANFRIGVPFEQNLQFSQYKLSVFIYFLQSYLGFFFAIFILNFLYSVIFLHVSKKERGKIKFSIFPPLLSIYFFIFMEPLPFFLLPADIWHIALSKYRYCSLRSQ